MADEQTILTGPGGTFKKSEPTMGEKLKFSIPAIILSLLLAIGISYGILAMVDGETRKQLDLAKTQFQDENKKLSEGLKASEQARQDLQKVVTDMGGEVAKLKTEKEEIKKSLGEVTDNFTKVAKSFETFADETKKLDKSQSEDLAKHENNINTLETKVKYIDEKLKKIDELAQDVNGLKSDTSELNKEYKVLRTDLTAVRNKADITEKDLTDLSERARLFQIRVLAARAREAAQAARQTDLKNLLDRLDDVEDGK